MRVKSQNVLRHEVMPCQDSYYWRFLQKQLKTTHKFYIRASFRKKKLAKTELLTSCKKNEQKACRNKHEQQ